MVDMTIVNKKLMLAGLFLSKFGDAALAELGFSSWTEAYNSLAFTIGGKPNSLKMYRQEYDPYFPNGRKGWVGREIRPTRLALMNEFGSLNISEFSQLVKTQFANACDVDVSIGKVAIAAGLTVDDETSFARRMITGQAAENYFEAHYAEVKGFEHCQLMRTTALGCGFDFKLTPPDGDFLAVEVKGLRAASGQIQLTEKEFKMAEYLKERFYLYVVSDFAHIPAVKVVENPLSSGISFESKKISSEHEVWVAYWAA